MSKGPDWDEKRTLRDWMAWWVSLPAGEHKRLKAAHWLEGNEPFIREAARYTELFGVVPLRDGPPEVGWYEGPFYPADYYAMGNRRW